ncbi:MAG: hypothetical protein R6V04_08860 [bacterium]
MNVKLVILIFGILIFNLQFAHTQHIEEEHEDHFLHPFLAHMALPDRPGEISVRVSPFQERLGVETIQDIGVHIEAGILPRLGLHVRNDAIKEGPYTEMMIMYALIQNTSLSRGISLFGQLSIPTGPIESNRNRTLFGLAARETLKKFVIINTNVHIDVKEEMADIGSSFVFRLSEKLYPIFEVHGEIGEEETHASGLFALKFRVKQHTGLGFGFQFPFSGHKEYDTQLLATFDLTF